MVKEDKKHHNKSIPLLFCELRANQLGRAFTNDKICL